jgi:hypothetical protein
MSIETLKSQINRWDFNYGNRFDVQIGNIRKYGNMPNFLPQYVESVQLPGRSFATSDIKFGTGFTQKRPYNTIFDDITMVVRLDSGMFLKSWFDGWQNLIHNKGTGYMEYLDSYKADMRINVYNRQNENVFSCIVLEAYPISIASIDVNHSSQNDIAKLSVTFAYKTWGSESSGDSD